MVVLFVSIVVNNNYSNFDNPSPPLPTSIRISMRLFYSAGRTFKKKKMMMRMAIWMKTLFLGVALPAAVGLALFAAWKGITISLLALMLAGIVGLKGLVASGKRSSYRDILQPLTISRG